MAAKIDIGAGPGTELIRTLDSLNMPACQQCYTLARRMNQEGAEWCREHLDYIIEDMLPRARQWWGNSSPWMKADAFFRSQPDAWSKLASLTGVLSGDVDAALRESLRAHAIAAIDSAESARDQSPPEPQGSPESPPPSIKISPDPLESVTACVTEFRRPESLQRLIDSIKATFPGLKIETQDTGGNLSAARNRLAERCRTPYYLMLEEDFVLDRRTDIPAMIDVLEHDPQTAGVSAVTLEPKSPGTANRGGSISWSQDIVRLGRSVRHRPGRSAPLRTPAGTEYKPCDLTLCFGLFRTDVLREFPWDEQIETQCEIIDWYYRVWLDARWRFALIRRPMVVHLRDRPGPEYAQFRHRDFMPYLRQKHGLSFNGPLKPDELDSLLPNVILHTVGRSNSTITVSMAAKAFGFHTGQLDRRFMEERRLRRENRRLWNNPDAPIDRLKVERILRTIPEPWILKEPCWSRTLGKWHPVFERYRPLLAYITKDKAAVLESVRRAGWNVGGIDFEACDKNYQAWPWRKFRFRAEDLGAAALMFDPNRVAQRPQPVQTR